MALNAQVSAVVRVEQSFEHLISHLHETKNPAFAEIHQCVGGPETDKKTVEKTTKSDSIGCALFCWH